MADDTTVDGVPFDLTRTDAIALQGVSVVAGTPADGQALVGNASGQWAPGTVKAAYGGTGHAGGFAVGDMLYASAAAVLSKLAAGANNSVMSVVGGLPAWVNSLALAGTLAVTGQAVFGPTNAGLSIVSDLGGVQTPASNCSFYISYTGTGSDAAYVDSFGTSTASGWVLRRARGTGPAPLNLQDGDQIGYVDFRSYSGTKFWQNVMIGAYVDGTFTSGQAPPSRLVFTTNLANGVSTERMRLDRNGYLYLNTTAQLSGHVSTLLTAVATASNVDWTVAIKGGTTTGSSYGLKILAGTNASDFPFYVKNVSDTTVLFSVSGIGAVNIAGVTTITRALGTDTTLQMKVGAEARERLAIDASGKLQWGPGGSSGTDVSLERSGSAALTLTGALAISGSSLSVGTNPASVGVIRGPNNASLVFRNAANSNNVFAVGVNASDQVEVGVNTSGAVVIGHSTGTVTVSAALTANSTLTVSGTSTLTGNVTSQGRLFVADGSAASPSLAFTNAGGNGFFHIGSTVFGVSVGGVEVGRLGSTLIWNGDVIASVIRRATVDGADTASVVLAGGGAVDVARGGYVIAYGNEHAQTGSVEIEAGNVAGGSVRFRTGNAERARVNNAGNFGFRTTDIEAWASGLFGIQLGSHAAIMAGTASSQIYLMDNAYTDGTWKYRTTASASYYTQNGGLHAWYVAPSGTIDTAITWTSAFTINNAGRSLFGAATAARSVGYSSTAKVQVEGLAFQDAAIAIVNNEANTNGPSVSFAKTRGSAYGSFTAVASGDILGVVDFAGADGTALAVSGRIMSSVDGAVSTGAVPGRLTILTASSAGALNERLRIDSSGNFGFATSDIEAWASTSYNALQLGAMHALMFAKANTDHLYLLSNAYYDGAWKYRTTREAAALGISNVGVFTFNAAQSGTLDTAVTWIELMRLDQSAGTARIGFLGAAAVARQSVGAAATDAASTQTLANNLRTALINLGLCQT